MSARVQLDLTAPAFLADPYPFYHRLREADPLHWHEMGFWLMTRYADAVAVLRDGRFGHPAGRTAEYIDFLIQQNQLSPIEFLFSHWMLSKNPPDHTRLRGLVNKAFTPSVVEALRPKIQVIVDGLLDAAQGRGTMDIIADLAYPLPVMVIAEMLGVPLPDRERFRQWSRDLIGVVDLVATPDAVQRGNVAIEKFMDYFRDLMAERRAQPQDDLLSALIAVHEEGERLSERELLANAILLFVAGHETTMNLIGNGMLALLRHPDQYVMLRDNPSLIVNAVEELLRYDSPVQFFGRMALEDMALEGKLIQQGQTVFIMPGAVNRDPAQFADPDRLDITRSDNRHLAFGYGIHFCLGAPLARAEAQIAIPALLRRFPEMELAGEPQRQETVFIRGLKSLPITLNH